MVSAASPSLRYLYQGVRNIEILRAYATRSPSRPVPSVLLLCYSNLLASTITPPPPILDINYLDLDWDILRSLEWPTTAKSGRAMLL